MAVHFVYCSPGGATFAEPNTTSHADRAMSFGYMDALLRFLHLPLRLTFRSVPVTCHTTNHKVYSSVAIRETNPNFMNGVPELLILRLIQQQEMYGYEIVQAIRSRTGAVISVGEGVVYPVLHALERAGALRAKRKTINGRSRIYYSVTPAGSRRLQDLSETWSSMASAIRDMLGGQNVEAVP
ncbi:MAG TPA: PadR family transcriptional regulator [Acidobacteriaceae bacterium]|nr:PadR family transcriptional regulator [Acidobacteriaceae bacterium]